ncbi:hypothetical protein J801_3960 [Acinetobacter baumannii 45002_8]|nr:hypothetical protein J801_4490 [Acinetobacter baumannii 45002_8]EXS92079.1 hypothetical protein J801_3960 [Acinetobacter baumannii 45002_8]EXS93916.1 hypothetical protein J803_3098 [Acinetobacter baumannii 45002_10]KCZ28193.1 hypothetical protein K027_4112 [Acinetobacter baumannii 45057_1]KCZ28414.1 hypothetical protein K027_3996 [Acinetobacter baumannii 45057_1]
MSFLNLENVVGSSPNFSAIWELLLFARMRKTLVMLFLALALNSVDTLLMV